MDALPEGTWGGEILRETNKGKWKLCNRLHQGALVTGGIRDKEGEWECNAERAAITGGEGHLIRAADFWGRKISTGKINIPTSLLSNCWLSPEARGQGNPREALHKGQPFRERAVERSRIDLKENTTLTSTYNTWIICMGLNCQQPGNSAKCYPSRQPSRNISLPNPFPPWPTSTTRVAWLGYMPWVEVLCSSKILWRTHSYRLWWVPRQFPDPVLLMCISCHTK